MTVKKQGENPCETLAMEGFSWGVLIGAFIGNFMVQIWGARKDSVLSVDDPVDADGAAIRIIPAWKRLLDF